MLTGVAKDWGKSSQATGAQRNGHSNPLLLRLVHSLAFLSLANFGKSFRKYSVFEVAKRNMTMGVVWSMVPCLWLLGSRSLRDITSLGRVTKVLQTSPNQWESEERACLTWKEYSTLKKTFSQLFSDSWQARFLLSLYPCFFASHRIQRLSGCGQDPKEAGVQKSTQFWLSVVAVMPNSAIRLFE